MNSWSDTIRGQFEVLDTTMARVLHGYILQDKYAWFYSGIDYSGVCVAFDKITISQGISTAVAKHCMKDYGGTITLNLEGGFSYSIPLDIGGCGVYNGKLIHYSQILENIIPNE